jgi:pyridoxal phosphate enzyme (YggS family)
MPSGAAREAMGGDDLAQRRRELEARIGEAARRSGRDPAAVTIVAVTKTVPAERVRAAVEAGFRTLAENRVQEAESKVEAVAVGLPEAPAWHLVGSLQSNKARRAVALFDVIQSVDSIGLASRLDRLAGELRPASRYPILLEVNVDADPAKSGFAPAAVERELSRILGFEHLRVDGLMTVGRLVQTTDEARPTFAALRNLSERLRAADDRLGAGLSMGMTDDFSVAIEEGATIVRIGRAIFGERH